MNLIRANAATFSQKRPDLLAELRMLWEDWDRGMLPLLADAVVPMSNLSAMLWGGQCQSIQQPSSRRTRSGRNNALLLPSRSAAKFSLPNKADPNAAT